eukprot:TRINITY_DN58232_c0_g1_i1.p1 TRINITY_DN58232_c0_g1~~TRINITY_DN58232_c0_g1_i1.p1  ORF type:complete len:169 (-),score=39.79 TRINITY_DN58232_c0_g1_i1:9-515(-)
MLHTSVSESGLHDRICLGLGLITAICIFFFQAEDGIRDAQESRGLGDVYKRQLPTLHEWCSQISECRALHSELQARLGNNSDLDLASAVRSALAHAERFPNLEAPTQIPAVPIQPHKSVQAPAWAVQGAAQLDDLVDDDQIGQQMLLHFQHLFDVSSVGGVLPKMNGI